MNQGICPKCKSALFIDRIEKGVVVLRCTICYREVKVIQ